MDLAPQFDSDAEDDDDPDKNFQQVNYKKKYGLPCRRCPGSGWRAFDLAGGKYIDFIHQLADACAAEVIAGAEFLECGLEDRARIIEDFEAARQYIVFTALAQIRPWRRIPRILAGIAHPDPDVGRMCARRARAQWNSLTPALQQNSHYQTKLFMIGRVRVQLDEFVDGETTTRVSVSSLFSCRGVDAHSSC